MIYVNVGENEMCYKLDIDKLFSFIFKEEKSVETQVTKVYKHSSNSTILKDTTNNEIRNNTNLPHNQLRYDLIKSMLDGLLGIGITSNLMTGNIEKSIGIDNLSFGETILFNTFIENEILIGSNK